MKALPLLVVILACAFTFIAQAQTVPGKYPQASTRQLTTSDVDRLPLAELRIMRNEIYPRHGFIFKKKETKELLRQPAMVCATPHQRGSSADRHGEAEHRTHQAI